MDDRAWIINGGFQTIRCGHDDRTKLFQFWNVSEERDGDEGIFDSRSLYLVKFSWMLINLCMRGFHQKSGLKTLDASLS
jgi:hypothetical protein